MASKKKEIPQKKENPPKRKFPLFRVLLFTILGVSAVIVIFPYFAYLASELLWWKSVGYLSVLFKFALIGIFAFVMPFVFSFAVMNLWLHGFRRHKPGVVITAIIWITSVGAGLWGFLNKELFIWNFNISTSMGFADPVFGLDAFFYMYRLPFIRMLLWMFTVFLLILFILDLVVQTKKEKPLFNKENKLQFGPSLIIGFIFNIVNFLALRFIHLMETLVRQPEAKIGLGYKTVMGYFFGNYVFMGALVLFSVLLVIRAIKGISLGRIIVYGIVVTGVYFLGTMAYPEIIENYMVKPNQLMMQKEYILNRIHSTRAAFGIVFEPYPMGSTNIAVVSGTIAKMRVWDNEPYKKVIKQLQEVKSYFDFYDVDVDKYVISNQIYQVVLAARELNPNNLPIDAGTWDNIHLRYTHGYGLTLSPANIVNSEGKPVFWIKDLENIAAFSNLTVTRPQIYFGELTSNYIIVRTLADEFEYSADTNRITTVYSEDRGIPIGNYFAKLVYSSVFNEKMLFWTKYIPPDSLLLYHREINERVRIIFPYLKYDDDPYITVVNGKLYWIMDAYTVSDRFPVAERFDTPLGKLNYIRNSVKVVIDAYTGDVTYYIVDPADPIAQTYLYLFPELFRTEVPPEFAVHFRYPSTLFAIQSQVLCAYHVEQNESFYNGEDVWKIPEQIYGATNTLFKPYFILNLLDDQYRFSLIQPFTPVGKENLSSWLIAYYQNGPKLALKYIDKTSSSLGPLQVESLINQNDEVSRMLTLWGQKGSKVFRGNIQFLPFGKKILYLKPLFLESENTSIPQLAKLIAILDGKVYLANTFEDLIGQLFLNTGEDLTRIQALQKSISDAYRLYLQIEEYRLDGNLKAYQETVDKLGEELKKSVNSFE